MASFGNAAKHGLDKLGTLLQPHAGPAVLPPPEAGLEPMRILAIDDNADILHNYRQILCRDTPAPDGTLAALEAALFGAAGTAAPDAPQRFNIDLSQDGEQGRDMARQALRDGHPYAVAFVDMRMPSGWDGLQTIEALWAEDPDLQVVICTAYSDFSWEEIVARLGRSDQLLILRKPFEKIEVLQLAYALSDKWRLLRERKVRLNELEQRVEERTHSLRQALLELEAYQGQLHHNATHDALTGLPNRALFTDRLLQALAHAKRHHHRLLVAFIDLDRFKWVNDTLGHTAGDQVLKEVAQRMAAVVRESDTVARFGGDEFVLLLQDCGNSTEASQAITRFAEAVNQPLLLNSNEINISCCIGCSVFPEDGDDADALLRFADTAMMHAKESGHSRLQMFNSELRVRIDERVRIATELRHAIKRGELMLHYQPQVDLKTGHIVGLEALLRWRHPTLGHILPDRFVPVAEETGLIEPITEWALYEACSQNQAWQSAGLAPICIAVNISAKQLGNSFLPALVAKCLAATQLTPDCLELELTESAAMENPDQSLALMRQLKALGIALAIDDFGTGYSNMHYLKRFPLDKLKLDGTFVQEITTDPRSLAIAGAVISMAQQLGLKVIGEMAETEGQVLGLYERGCDQVQGYYFSTPLSAAACAPLLQARQLPLPPALSQRGGQHALQISRT